MHKLKIEEYGTRREKLILSISRILKAEEGYRKENNPEVFNQRSYYEGISAVCDLVSNTLEQADDSILRDLRDGLIEYLKTNYLPLPIPK